MNENPNNDAIAPNKHKYNHEEGPINNAGILFLNLVKFALLLIFVVSLSSDLLILYIIMYFLILVKDWQAFRKKRKVVNFSAIKYYLDNYL